MSKIRPVPTDLVPHLWPAVEKYAEAACEYNPFMTALDVARAVMRGSARLFVAYEGAHVQGFAVMEVVQYPSRKVANVLACGGENGFLGAAIHELLPELKQWGAEQGADALSMTGRPGWYRALQDEGGHATKLVMWWTELGGNVTRRRQLGQSDADRGLRAMVGSETLPH